MQVCASPAGDGDAGGAGGTDGAGQGWANSTIPCQIKYLSNKQTGYFFQIKWLSNMYGQISLNSNMDQIMKGPKNA